MRWLAALLALWVCSAAQASSAADARPSRAARVTVERNGKRWTADYRLGDSARVWAFAKSALPREARTPWRLRTVRVLTPGVRLERLGNFDALVARSGAVPKHVRLSFTPSIADIDGGYTPALVLADGSVALYGDQFKLLPVKSAAALAKLGPGEGSLPENDRPTLMTFVDHAGPVLVHGKRERRPTLDDGGAYVLFGRATPVIGSAMTTIMDPSLPKWIADYLNTEMPRILAHYRDELGPSPMGQPTLLVAWAGREPHSISLSGSVLPGMVVMTLSGDGLLKPSDKVSQYARWFVSHEAAHFWLGQAVHYSHPRESWITEGGAELLAFRATAAADPAFDFKARMSEAKTECLPFLARGGIASAYEREGDFRAYYACGVILALAAEKASGGDFADFVRALMRRATDQTVTREEWLALLSERARNPAVAAAVAKLLDGKQADPSAAMDRFISDTGIADQFAPAKVAA